MAHRRWAAAMVLGALLAPPPAVFAAVAQHGCDGAVCVCGHGAPAPTPVKAPQAAKSCHESAPVKPSCAMRAACSHDLPALASTLPFVLIAPVAVGLDDRPEALTMLARHAAAPGHLRIDAPPPKPA